MKKFTFTPLAIAVLALMSASCVNSNYNLDDAKVTATIEVNKNSELNSDSLLGFKEEAGISKDANGDFRIELPSKEIIAPAPVAPDAPVVFDGTLDVDMVTAPDIFHKSSGGEIANPGIKISISNPSPISTTRPLPAKSMPRSLRNLPTFSSSVSITASPSAT